MSQKRKTRKVSVDRRHDFLTPTQVADRLLVAPVTVRLWASRGMLRSVSTPGGHRRFRVEDVEAFYSARQHFRRRENRPPSRVLIIDDDEQYARSLSQLIATQAPAVDVEIALDGFTAGIKCEALRPDVVTLDLQMPDMDGFAVCRLLKEMFGNARPRIIALSGYLSAENIKHIKTAGADACFPKTTRSEHLLRELGFPGTVLARRTVRTG